MRQFRVKNQFPLRPQTPHIHSFFSHAVSVPQLKVRGSLSHLCPRALLLVITRATITRRRHTCTHFQCASRDGQPSLWIQISMQTCAGTVEQGLQRLGYFGRVFLETQALDTQQDFREQPLLPARFYIGSSQSKKKRLLCDDLVYSVWWFKQFLNRTFYNVGFIPPRDAFGGCQRHFGHPLKRHNRTRWRMVIERYQIKSCWIVSYQTTDEQATAKTLLSAMLTHSLVFNAKHHESNDIKGRKDSKYAFFVLWGVVLTLVVQLYEGRMN